MAITPQRPLLRFSRQQLREMVYKRVTKPSSQGKGQISLAIAPFSYLLPDTFPSTTDLSVGVPFDQGKTLVRASDLFLSCRFCGRIRLKSDLASTERNTFISNFKSESIHDKT